MKNSSEQSCEICFRIVCKRCGWVASDSAILQIQQGKLIACPECGWKPT